MPAVAEVQFKAVNSQQVVGAFKSVGDSASTATTKVQQNSNAMKTMGQGMKSSMGGIAQVTTAFATLSLSIVSTWRAYRDLGDAQIAVDKANLRVKKTTEAIRKSEAEVAKLRKESAKGGLENVVATHKIQLMEQKLAKDRKEGKKSALELRVQEDAILVARKEGVPSSKKLTDAENKLQLQKEQLGVQTDVANEAQERFNDTQQDFYLSIIPSVLSGVALLTSAFKGIGSTLRGGGGLIGGLGPIGLILGGITLAIIAFKTNFLGLRDVVGGVIDWIKERFGLWKDTIEKVFNLIKSGNWSGAFALIQEAAAKFWEDLKKSVPFFGEVEKLVNNIRGGNWKGAFLQIWKAASDAWATIKNNIPILGKIEDFLAGIAAGDWKGTFTTIANAIKTAFNETLGKGIEWVFGANWKVGLDAWLKLQETEAAINKRSLILQYAITINASIKAITGIDVLKWFKEHPLTLTEIPIVFGGISMAVEDVKFREAMAKGSMIIVTALGEALGRVARLLDPYVADMIRGISWENFVTIVNEAGAKIKLAGEGIWNFIFGGIKDGFQGQDWSKLFADLGKKVQEAWQTYAPDTQKAIQDKVINSPLGKQFKLTVPVTPKVVEDAPIIIQKGIQSGANKTGQRGGYQVPITPNTKDMPAELKKQMTTVIASQKPVIKINGDAKAAVQAGVKAVAQINNMRATIKVGTVRVGASAGVHGGVHLQHGYQGTVKRPTMFIAGEGGRPEDVTVRPRGSVQRGGSGGGGGSTHITVSFEPQEFMQFIRYRINDNQGVVK